jgi:hypothetical protein
MESIMTHTTVAAQPGWFLAVFTNSNGIDGVRCEQVIAWEIQRMTLPNGLVIRSPMPITAESRNMDLACTIWGLKRPDGKFVVPLWANEGIGEEKLSRLAHLMETESVIEKPTVASPSIAYRDAALVPALPDTWDRGCGAATSRAGVQQSGG